jgi:hypothetical protein
MSARFPPMSCPVPTRKTLCAHHTRSSTDPFAPRFFTGGVVNRIDVPGEETGSSVGPLKRGLTVFGVE